MPLGLAELELNEPVDVIDLDDPVVLRRGGCGPRTSPRGTGKRRSPRRASCRASPRSAWTAVVVHLRIDLGQPRFRSGVGLAAVRSVRALVVDDSDVIEAADFFGLRSSSLR